MGFFSKKPTQETSNPDAGKSSSGSGDVHDYSMKLEAIVTPCVKAWQEIEHDTKHLVDIVRLARTQKVEVEEVDQFVGPALAAMTQYQDMLKDCKMKYDALEYKSKFPEQTRKDKAEWDAFFGKQISDIPMIIEALSPPDYLKMMTVDGKNKQIMFLSGMGTLEYMKQLEVMAKRLS
jgi:hypothetical protein